jgi:hypothetical protein
MSLLNRNSKVSAMMKKGFYTGLADWDGKDPRYIKLHNIPKSAKIALAIRCLQAVIPAAILRELW